MPKKSTSKGYRVSPSQIADHFAEVVKDDGKIWKVTCRPVLLKLIAKALELKTRKGRLHDWSADWIADSKVTMGKICLHFVRGPGKGKRYKRMFAVTLYPPIPAKELAAHGLQES